MRPIIFPYKMTSAGAKALAKKLGCKRVYPNRKYCPSAYHLIINWGHSKGPTTWGEDCGEWLNPVMSVAAAANKLTAFKIMNEVGVSIPEFTTDPYEAADWFYDGHTVVERSTLTGHGGEGIYLHVPNSGEEDVFDISDSPLWVKYIKKAAEYRVHVFNGEVIDVQQKRNRKDFDTEEVNYQIRNYDNGWVFCREDVDPDDTVLEEAIKAVKALGLNFGAVDIIWNEYHARAFVLEVNTAPGLQGSSVQIYAKAIEEYCNNT